MLGLRAAAEAVREAGVLERNVAPERVAVILGAGCGGVLEAERYRRQLHAGARPRPSLLMPFPACNLADVLGNLYGFFGPRSTIATACSSSATAIGYAADLIRSRRADVVIAGGAESLSELTFAGFNALRSVDRETCRPFDRDREGLVLGEGASILVLESQELAEADGMMGYGTVLGYGICADAYHMTSPDPNGDGAARSMSLALSNAGAHPDAVGYINAHGTGTPVNDRTETLAIKKLFDKRARAIPVSSTKSAHGHCLGAAGALEAAVALLALRHGVIPPTVNQRELDLDCDLDYVANEARLAEIELALSNSFAFGGNNTTLVFGK
jgi:3-oxoacyl-[acyl-carrier-protein] synthase II